MATYAQTQLARSGLVAYWRLGDTSGTTATDSEGTNPGTYTGGYTLNQAGLLVPGGDNSPSSLFNGTTGYVTVPDATALKPASFTIELIANVLNDVSQGLVAKYSIGGGTGFGLATNSSGHLLIEGNGGAADTGVVVPTGIVHLALSYDGTNYRAYLNGSQAGAAWARAYTPAAVALTIGQAIGEFANIYAQEVSYYNRALTAAEIALDAQIVFKTFSAKRVDRTLQLAGGFIDHGYPPPAGNYSIKPTDRLLRAPAQTAAVTYTLPPASQVGVSQRFEVQDEGGTAGTYNITIKSATGTTVAVLSANGATWSGYWNGSSWTTRQPQLTTSVPTNGQVLMYNSTTGQWGPANPSGGQRLAAAANTTSTPTSASASSGLGTSVAIPGTAISVPASAGVPVVLRYGATIQQTTAGDGVWIIELVETTSTPTTLGAIYARLPNTVAAPVCYASAYDEFDIGVVTGTRTFELMLALWSVSGSSPAANTLNAPNDPSFLRAVAE